MNTGRYRHTATLLPNGDVLVTGGIDNNGSFLNTSELYNPVSGTWSNSGLMNTVRLQHTATLLSNGKVLVTGGCIEKCWPCLFSASTDLYDPVSNTWVPTGSMNVRRGFHTATLLPNGKVLVTGGITDGFNGIASAELYDPTTGTWTIANSLSMYREEHTSTLLTNGKVLIAGAHAGSSGPESLTTQQYDPSSGLWSNTAPMNSRRVAHIATLIPNGKVLVAGGQIGPDVNNTAAAEVYSISDNTWQNIAPMGTARSYHGGILLPNGNVLVAGGYVFRGASNLGALATAEVYNPSSDTWSETAPMNMSRGEYGSAVLLPNGKVLVAGGDTNGYYSPNATATAELYTPDNNCSNEAAVKPYTFTSGTPAKAAEINANFDVLYQRINTPRCQ
jgi:N-acetylneuraminic acid mutarotase